MLQLAHISHKLQLAFVTGSLSWQDRSLHFLQLQVMIFPLTCLFLRIQFRFPLLPPSFLSLCPGFHATELYLRHWKGNYNTILNHRHKYSSCFNCTNRPHTHPAYTLVWIQYSYSTYQTWSYVVSCISSRLSSSFWWSLAERTCFTQCTRFPSLRNSGSEMKGHRDVQIVYLLLSMLAPFKLLCRDNDGSGFGST